MHRPRRLHVCVRMSIVASSDGNKNEIFQFSSGGIFMCIKLPIRMPKMIPVVAFSKAVGMHIIEHI